MTKTPLSNSFKESIFPEGLENTPLTSGRFFQILCSSQNVQTLPIITSFRHCNFALQFLYKLSLI